MAELKAIKYSEVKSNIFNLLPEKEKDDDMALFTHYLQNSDHYHNFFLKSPIYEYFTNNIPNNLRVKWDVPFPPPKNAKFTFIDLFCGIGGFRLALQNNGGNCVFSSDIDPYVKNTYECNFGETPFGDITEGKIKKYIPAKFDILCAGFPCQAFSIAGYQKGFSDTRGTLFFEIENIIKKHQPKVVFLENVKNLVSHDKGKTFEVIIDTLENKLKYKAYPKVLNSMVYANIPQNRERIFIVAFDPKQVPNYENFNFPKEIELTKTIHDILEKDKQDDCFYYQPNHQYYPELEKIVVKKDTVYQWRRVYVRENKSNVCPTLTANMGTGGHNGN